MHLRGRYGACHTPPPSPSLSISSLLFFTLTLPSLPWSMYGFKWGIFGPLMVLLLIIFSKMSYLHAHTHFCYALSSNFIIWYSLYVHKAHKSTLTARVHRTAPTASRPRCEWSGVNRVAGQPFIVSSHRVPRGWGFEVGGGGWLQCKEENISWSFE